MAKTFEAKYFKGDVTDFVAGKTVVNTGSVALNKGAKGQFLNLSSGKYLTYSATPLPATGAVSVVAFARCGLGSVFGTNHMAILSDTVAGTARAFSIGMNTVANRANIDMSSPNYRTFVWTQDHKWHCFVFTLPGSETTSISTSAFYVDGIAQATSSTTTGALVARTATTIVGGTSTGKGADIAYLAVHDTVLTQSEIDAYQAQFNSFIGFDKPKRGFLMNKPNDLSSEVNKVVGSQQGAPRTWSVSGGTPTINGEIITLPNTGVASGVVINNFWTIGKRYKVSITISNYSGTSTVIGPYDGSNGGNAQYSANGNYIYEYTPGTVNCFVYCRTTNGATVTVNSIQELTGLVAAYNMRLTGNKVVDISGNGKDITFSGQYISTKDGTKITNNTNGYGTATMYQLGTQNFSVAFRARYQVGASNILFRMGGGYNTSDVGVSITTAGIQFSSSSRVYINGGGGIPSTNEWNNYTLVCNRSGNLQLYVNGISVSSTDISSYAAESIANNTTLYFSFNGVQGSIIEFEDFRWYNRALSLQEAKDYNNQFAKQPYLVEDFSDAPADGNAIVPRDWIKTSGTFKGGEYSPVMGEQIGDTNFSGNGFWQAVAGAVISGNKLTLDADASYVQDSLNAVKTPGKRYRVTMNIESISGTVSIYAGNSTNGNASFTTTGVQTKEFTYIGVATTNRWVIYSATAAVITNVSLVEIDPLPTLTKGSKYIECVTAGNLGTSSKLAFTTWRFGFLKGADANVFEYTFVAKDLTPRASGVTGMYTIVIGSDEALYLIKDFNTYITRTAAGYVPNNTYLEVEVRRTNAGIFTTLIRGGSFVPTAGYDGWTLVSVTGGSGTNPSTAETTYTTSNYSFFNTKAGDRIFKPITINGVIV